MKPKKVPMEGRYTFNTFAYLWTGAHSLSKSATEHQPGGNYCRVASALFAAFTVEAHLNHIGEDKIPSWDEPRISWKDKLELLARELGIELRYDRRPIQTIANLFRFRDRLAHGRTLTEDIKYKNTGNLADDIGVMDPKWLKKYWKQREIDRALEDAGLVIHEFHRKAGYDEASLHRISGGSFVEQPRSKKS